MSRHPRDRQGGRISRPNPRHLTQLATGRERRVEEEEEEDQEEEEEEGRRRRRTLIHIKQRISPTRP